MPNFPQNDSLPAFKEWQVVCDALASGEQSIILRKGGIAEGRQGFRWQHESFFLFPTRFHQQLDGVRGERSIDTEAAVDEMAIGCWTEVDFSARLTEWSLVEALSPFHIWTPEVVRERFEWGDEPGLSVAAVRVRRLQQPWLLKNPGRREFGGCRSWLKLPRAEWVADDLPEDRISAARDVLDDRDFAERRDSLKKLLAGFR